MPSSETSEGWSDASHTRGGVGEGELEEPKRGGRRDSATVARQMCSGQDHRV